MDSAVSGEFRAVERVPASQRGGTWSRRIRFFLVLLALVVAWTVRPAPASAQAAIPCAGDCDSLGSVTIDELVKAVSIALGDLPLYRCPLLDVNLDDAVTVDELVSAVGNALGGCPTGELSFDQFPVAMPSNGEETVGVTAKDESGNRLDWTVVSSAPNVVSAGRNGDAIELNALQLGRAAIAVTTRSELRSVHRILPVRVYDPTLLDVGEILIRYIDTFQCIPTEFVPFFTFGAVSFYQPVVPEGWRPLGSFAVGGLGCPNIDGRQWMMAVKENPENADPVSPPLAAPLSYRRVFHYRDLLPLSRREFSLWWPECPAGYVAMGEVGSRESGPNADDATCVREDLTVPGVVGDPISFLSFFRTAAPPNTDYDYTTTYLETGTFSRYLDIPSVLAVELPLRIDTPQRTWLPHVTSFSAADNVYLEPLLVKAMLVPFTAVLSGSEYAARGVGWMVENSPLVRVERLVRWDQVFFAVNTGSTEQSHSRMFTKGVSQETSTTISFTTGVSLTTEGGFSFLGFGGKVSATVSYEFGYETQHSVGEFVEESTNVSINVPPHKAAAAWRERSTIVVKLHRPDTGRFQTIVSQPMYDSLSFVTDDYPD